MVFKYFGRSIPYVRQFQELATFVDSRHGIQVNEPGNGDEGKTPPRVFQLAIGTGDSHSEQYCARFNQMMVATPVIGTMILVAGRRR
jgi:hypothetical protein